MNGITAFVDASNVYVVSQLSSHQHFDILFPYAPTNVIFDSTSSRLQIVLSASRYGSNDETSIILRSSIDGKLLVNQNSSSYDREMLPEIEGVLTAGDVRALEMPGLATMHTLWLREHNRLASEIKAASRNLNDEEIFQIARKILIAEMQNVVYGEYLPVVLGEQAMRKYDLELPKKQKDFSKYKSNIDPSITNSFATAAYRFHS